MMGRIAAVAVREVRDLFRRKTTFALRTLYAGATGIFVFGLLAVATGSQQRVPGSHLAQATFTIFLWLTPLQCVALLAVGALLGVTSIRAERSHRTIGLMVLSGLRPVEIVLGKTLGLLAIAALLLLAGLPSLAIIGWGGGLDYAWILRFVGLALMLATLGIVTGIASACWLNGSVSAGLAALGSVSAYVALPPWLSSIDWLGFLDEVAPTTAILEVATQGLRKGRFWAPMVVVSLVVLVLTAWAGRELARAPGRSPAHGLRGAFRGIDEFFERINLGGIRFARKRRPGFLRGNPVAWLARTSGGIGTGRNAFRIAFVNAAIAVTVAPFVFKGAFWAKSALWLMATLTLLFPIVAGACAVAGERVRKTLPVLMVTPLSGARLLSGKSLAACFLFVLVIGPFAVFWMLIGRALPDLQPNILAGLALLTGEAACGYALALVLSILAESPLRAGLSAAGLLVIVNGAPLAYLWMFKVPGNSIWSTIGALLWLVSVSAPSMLLAGGIRVPRREFAALFLVVVTILGSVLALVLAAKPPADAMGWGLNRVGVYLVVLSAVFYLVVLSAIFYRFALVRIDPTLGRSS